MSKALYTRRRSKWGKSKSGPATLLGWLWISAISSSTSGYRLRVVITQLLNNSHCKAINIKQIPGCKQSSGTSWSVEAEGRCHKTNLTVPYDTKQFCVEKTASVPLMTAEKVLYLRMLDQHHFFPISNRSWEICVINSRLNMPTWKQGAAFTEKNQLAKAMQEEGCNVGPLNLIHMIL